MSTRLQTGNTKSHSFSRNVTRWIQRNPQRVVELLMVTGVLLGSILLMQILPVKYLMFPLILLGRAAALIIYLRTPN
jgi:integral membrane sensor domain MASE1